MIFLVFQMLGLRPSQRVILGGAGNLARGGAGGMAFANLGGRSAHRSVLEIHLESEKFCKHVGPGVCLRMFFR